MPPGPESSRAPGTRRSRRAGGGAVGQTVPEDRLCVLPVAQREHVDAESAVAVEIDAHVALARLCQHRGLGRLDPVQLAPRPAHEVVGADPVAVHLETVLVPSRKNARNPGAASAVDRGDGARVLVARHVGAGDSQLSGERIGGADHGQGEPRPGPEVGEREEVLLPGEVAAVGARGDERVVQGQHHVPPFGVVELGGKIEVRIVDRALGAMLLVLRRNVDQVAEAERVDEDEAQVLPDVDVIRPRAARDRPHCHPRRKALKEPALCQGTVPALGPLGVPVVVSESKDRASRLRGGDLGLEDALAAAPILVALRRHAIPVDIVTEEDHGHVVLPEAFRVFENVVVEVSEHRVDEIVGVRGRQLRGSGIADQEDRVGLGRGVGAVLRRERCALGSYRRAAATPSQSGREESSGKESAALRKPGYHLDRPSRLPCRGCGARDPRSHHR